MTEELNKEDLLKLIKEAIPQVETVDMRGKLELDCYVIAIQYIVKLAKTAYARGIQDGKESKSNCT
jgi:hypothetical protein